MSVNQMWFVYTVDHQRVIMHLFALDVMEFLFFQAKVRKYIVNNLRQKLQTQIKSYCLVTGLCCHYDEFY